MYRILYWIVRIITFIPLLILYPFIIKNKKNFKKGKAVVVCNHQSNIDAPLLLSRLPHMYVLSKKELMKSFFTRFLLNIVKAIPVDRKNPEISVIKKCLTVLKENKKLCIFPEGTRKKISLSENDAIKNGASMFAIKEKAPIIPMIFVNKTRIFRFNKLIIGEPIDTTIYEGKASKENIEILSKIMHNKMTELIENNKKKPKVVTPDI